MVTRASIDVQSDLLFLPEQGFFSPSIWVNMQTIHNLLVSFKSLSSVNQALKMHFYLCIVIISNFSVY